MRSRWIGRNDSISLTSSSLCCQQYLGGQLMSNLNTSHGAVFFWGVSSPV